MDNANPTADRLRAKLNDGAKQLDLSLSDHQTESLIQFLHLLYKWNRVYNLTAVRSKDEMVGRHILDSLSVLHWLPPMNDAKPHNNALATYKYDVIDVGTGAGLPVLPLAIVRPDLTFLSVESNGKKTRFQQQALMALDLRNVQVEQARVEDVYDHAPIVISRAFTAPEKFLAVVEKNCSAQSRVIVMLGIKERLPSTLPAGFTLHDMQEIKVPQFNSTRHIAVCLYTAPTERIERI